MDMKIDAAYVYILLAFKWTACELSFDVLCPKKLYALDNKDCNTTARVNNTDNLRAKFLALRSDKIFKTAQGM